MSIPKPATLALLEAGIQPVELAETLGMSRQAVSQHLAGETASTSTDLLEAIAARGDQHLADKIRTLIDEARQKRRADAG